MDGGGIIGLTLGLFFGITIFLFILVVWCVKRNQNRLLNRPVLPNQQQLHQNQYSVYPYCNKYLKKESYTSYGCV